MNVLIIGGYGFLGSHISEKYYKEGHKVYILDNLSCPKVKKLDIKHKFFNMGTSNNLVSEIFKDYDFDLVIYLIKSNSDSFYGLKNILDYSSKSRVKKFIYISDIYNYKEDMNLKIEENLCILFNKMNDMSIHVLRLCKVYGERQDIIDYEKFLKETNKNCSNYIYIGDAVHAAYNTARYAKSFFLNISSNKIADNESITQEISWNIKYNNESGKEKTEKWYKKAKREKNKNAIIKNIKGSNSKNIRQLLENIIVGIISFWMNLYFKNHKINIYIDFNYIYIALIAVTYGMKQGSLAILFSLFSSIVYYIINGQNIISIVHDNNILISFILYIFTGFFLSYFIENKNIIIESSLVELKDNKDKFDFVYDRYTDMRRDKKSLEEQILNKEDSIIVLYQTIRKLDYLDPDLVFNNAVLVVSEIMKCSQVTLYVLTNSQKYLRLISKTEALDESDIKHSIDITKYTEIKKAIDFDYIFINKFFIAGIPMMMAPVNVSNNATFLIGLSNIEFESLTLYKKNMFKGISILIADALKRAYIHDLSLKGEKYIENTIILNTKYFKKIVEEKYNRQNVSCNNIILLIKEYTYSSLINCVRKGDYVGTNDKGEIFILLTNIKKHDLSKVITRLQDSKIEIQIVHKSYILT